MTGGLDWLEPGGTLVLELAPDQAGPLRTAAARSLQEQQAGVMNRRSHE